MKPVPERAATPSSGAGEPTLVLTGLVAKNSVDFIRSAFECLQRGMPIVLFKSEADTHLVGELNVDKVITPTADSGWAQLEFEPSASQSVAQIAFTSGTEGKPKGILISHANLADMVQRLNTVMHMDSSIREYVGVPVYHSFGFGRCRAVATVGGAFYIPPNGFNPLEIRQMLIDGEINAISAVPSLWRALFECSDIFGEETQRVKWIEIGSQYMSAAEKLRLKRLFPAACIVQHYGLTEASRSTFLEIHQHDDPAVLESVGRVVGDTEVKITDAGRIAVRGSVVARQLLREGQLQALTDADGWFVTGDLGELRDGYLTYKGRADDIINCGGVKVVPDEMERRLREKTGAPGGIACCRIPDAMRGDGVLVAYLKDLGVAPSVLERAAVDILNSLGIQPGRALKLLALESLPVTPTGKVKRAELAQLYHQQVAVAAAKPVGQQSVSAGEQSVPAGEPSARERELVELWKSLLGVSSVSVNESFLDLGGDSLTAISAIVKMKKLGIPEQTCRGILQGKTIAQIAREEQVTSGDTGGVAKTGLIEPINRGFKEATNVKFVRGLLVLAVIFAHWSAGIFERLPASLDWLAVVLAPLFSIGTPGFAVMYGVAIGCSFYPIYSQSPGRLYGLIRPIALLLTTGVMLLAVVKIMHYYLSNGNLTFTNITNSFYSVLTYYLLATLSLPLWFAFLKRSGAPIIMALASAVLLHLFYLLYMDPLTAIPAEGLVELGKLLIAAKYSYFNMTCGVFLGLAIGIGLYERSLDLRAAAAAWLGVFAAVAAVWWSELAGGVENWLIWPAGQVEAWKWLMYTGVCLLLLVAMERVLAHYHQLPKAIVIIINIVACFGLLAFPLFVLHELVLPLKLLIEMMGVPGSLALLSMMAAFVAITTYLVYKSYRLQFD